MCCLRSSLTCYVIVSARVKGGLFNSSQQSKDVTLSNTTHRPTQVHNASDLYSDSMLSAQPSTSHGQGLRSESSRAFQHIDMLMDPHVFKRIKMSQKMTVKKNKLMMSTMGKLMQLGNIF